MGTFHSVFSKILRFNAERIGFPNNFTIYDTQDSKSLIKDIIKELNLDDKTYKPSMVFGRISAAKNNLISPEAYSANSEIQLEDKQSRRPELGRIYQTYANRCLKAGAMDFDDLLYFTNVLLRDFPDVLHYYQQKFQYILVDEYQDTNYAQYLIVKKLAAAYQNICVVGDDAQSIYSFRGANIENILNFRKDYPDFALYKLEQNYRSTKNIVEAANSIIKKNKDQILKTVWTDNGEGAKIKVQRSLTDNEEGRTIAQAIFERKTAEGARFQDFAILYRTNKQSRAFEEALRKLNMPYKIYGGLSFYQRTLDWSLCHPRTILLILLGTIGLNVYLYTAVPKGFFPQQDTGRIMGFIQADQSISFQAMRGKLSQLMAIVQEDEAVQNVIGFTGGSQRNGGQMFITLKPLNERDVTLEQVINRLRPKLSRVAGASLFLQGVQDIRIGGRPSNSQFQYAIQADSLEELQTWETNIRQA